MVRLLAVLLVFVAAVASPAGASDKQGFEGFFWDEPKTAIVQMSLTENGIEGRTVWLKDDTGQTDLNNPTEELRSRPIIGMVFLSGFEYVARKNRWKDGKVYDPNDGKTYDAKMSLVNGGNTIKMRGYVGVALFGRTVKFERVDPKQLPSSLTEQSD